MKKILLYLIFALSTFVGINSLASGGCTAAKVYVLNRVTDTTGRKQNIVVGEKKGGPITSIAPNKKVQISSFSGGGRYGSTVSRASYYINRGTRKSDITDTRRYPLEIAVKLTAGEAVLHRKVMPHLGGKCVTPKAEVEVKTNKRLNGHVGKNKKGNEATVIITGKWVSEKDLINEAMRQRRG
jgi:hypothetical protein